MKCHKCGTVLPDESKFCGSCGATQTPAETPVEVVTEEILETEEAVEVEEKIEATKEVTVAEEMATTEPVGKLDKKKKPILMIVLIALAFVAIVYIGVSLIGSMGGKETSTALYEASEMPLFYLDKDDLYAVYPGDKEGVEIVADYYDSGYAKVVNENELYYIDDGDLYFKSRKKDSVEIDSDVAEIYVNRLSPIVVYINDDGELYVYDGKDSEKVIKDIEEIYDIELVDEMDAFVVSYANDDYEDVLVAYVDGEIIELADGVYADITYVGGDKIIYAETEDYREYDVMQADFSGDSEKLFSVEGGQFEFNDDGSKALFIDGGELAYFDGKDTIDIEKDVVEFELYTADGFNAVVTTEDDVTTWFEGDEELTVAFEKDDYYTYDVTSDLSQFVVANDDYELVVYSKKGDGYDDKEYDLDDIEDIRILSDDKTVLITDDGDDLYRYKIGGKDADEVAEDVYYFSGSEIDNLMIRTKDNEVLYYNGKDTVEVASDVTDYYRIDLSVPSYSYMDDRGNFFFGQKGKEVEEMLDDVEEVVNYSNSYIYLLDEDDEIYLYKAGDKEAKEMGIDADDIFSFWNMY